MKPKGANKQGNAYGTYNIRCAIPEGGGGHSDRQGWQSKTSTNCFKMTQEQKLEQK